MSSSAPAWLTRSLAGCRSTKGFQIAFSPGAKQSFRAQPFRISYWLSRFPPQLPGNYALPSNSNDFIFDQEIIAQAVWFGARIEEILVPHRYFP